MGYKETVEQIRADLKRWYSWDETKIQALGEKEYWRIVTKLEDDAYHYERLAEAEKKKKRGRRKK